MQRVQVNTLMSVRDNEHFAEVLDKLKEVLGEDVEPTITMVAPEKLNCYSSSEIHHTFGASIAPKFLEWAINKKFTAENGARTYYWSADVQQFVKEHEELFLNEEEKEALSDG